MDETQNQPAALREPEFWEILESLRPKPEPKPKPEPVATAMPEQEVAVEVSTKLPLLFYICMALIAVIAIPLAISLFMHATQDVYVNAVNGKGGLLLSLYGAICVVISMLAITIFILNIKQK